MIPIFINVKTVKLSFVKAVKMIIKNVMNVMKIISMIFIRRNVFQKYVSKIVYFVRILINAIYV